jgi:hypothetical protein
MPRPKRMHCHSEGHERGAVEIISRAIGIFLGNDLGQMRLQFDVSRYLVEPPYRDDNPFLWDFPADSSPPKGEISTRWVRRVSLPVPREMAAPGTCPTAT